MIRKVITYPNPLLSKVSRPIKEIDGAVREMLSDMAETMYAADGVGMAAPQIGENVRAIVIDVGESGRQGEGLLKMVNPEILSCEGEIEWDEGCLSVPDLRVMMQRCRHIRVRCLDENGISREFDAHELLAVAIQHEVDHLDGKLIIDNVSRIKRDLYLRKRKKQEPGERRPINL